MKVGEHEVIEGLYYTRGHEWVKMEGKLARVGVTDYAQGKLGDVVYVELPSVGKQVKQASESKGVGMELGAVESIKAVSAVYSPLSGSVKEVNAALRERPELVNTSPYKDGWICVLEPKSIDVEIKQLMDSKGYSEYLKKLGKLM